MDFFDLKTQQLKTQQLRIKETLDANIQKVLAHGNYMRNILSKKLCALSRREPKDMADILSIAGRFSFAWPEIFGKARQKDLWVEPIETSRTIQEFPVDLLAAVKWVQPVDPGLFAADLKAIHRDIFHGQANSLASPPPQNAKFNDRPPKPKEVLPCKRKF